MTKDIHNADHPCRKSAIEIIDDIIEPLVDRGIEDEEYYDLEDKITDIINENVIAYKPKKRKHITYYDIPTLNGFITKKNI